MGQSWDKPCCSCSGSPTSEEVDDECRADGSRPGCGFFDGVVFEGEKERRSGGGGGAGGSAAEGSTQPSTPVEADSPIESASSPTAAERGMVAKGGPSDTPDPEQEDEEEGGGSGDEIVDAALEQTRLLMRTYDVIEAEALLSKTLDKLGRLGFHAAAGRLRDTELYQEVLELVAQYDATVNLLHSDKFQTLYENDCGKFELMQQTAKLQWDYRMTVNVDAPLAECLSTGHETDLVPQAQKLVTSTAPIGPAGAFLFAELSKLPIVFFQVELCFEHLLVRDRRTGFVMESIRTRFPDRGRNVPAKDWRAVRPWIFTANLWIPRGGGKEGTCLVQVTRFASPVTPPQWIMNFVFRQVACSFMSDLSKSTSKAMQRDSPWSARIEKDADGLYGELRKIEAVASKRSEIIALPEKEVFDRQWRLWPTPLNTQPSE